ncbi:MAG: VIT family protein [Gammaproteobacteria bacterium]|nr:MAG: VIT family protein [Gammaproteobacteria bacterium]
MNEKHYSNRTGWLRAAVLGANDGIVSTASLIAGVAAAAHSREEVMLAAVAGMVAGALSMAAGEYVSVSSQKDTEEADLARERRELASCPEAEQAELATIYRSRGLSEPLARQVAEALMAHDALDAHARDELGINELSRAHPVVAALSSAASFMAGAFMPVLVTAVTPLAQIPLVVSLSSLLVLSMLGFIAARTGGAHPLRGALRVLLLGALAMGATTLIGHLFGLTVT